MKMPPGFKTLTHRYQGHCCVSRRWSRWVSNRGCCGCVVVARRVPWDMREGPIDTCCQLLVDLPHRRLFGLLDITPSIKCTNDG